MSAQTIDVIRQRVASVCAGSPFGLRQAVTPFGFDLQPTGQIDEVFRLESEVIDVIGGFNFTEDRTDAIRIWVARKQQADPEGTYTRLLADASSLRAAVIRYGEQGGGDYGVPDGGGGQIIQREAGKEYAVLRLTIPVNYEANV